MNPFLITGLPRSRTAWMSVFCTTVNSLCYHEPIARMRQVEDLELLLNKPTPKFVGASDSALGFFLPWIMENLKPRVVIIDRPIEHVRRSVAELGVPHTNYIDVLKQHLLRFRHHPDVLWIPFHALEEQRMVEKAFWHLLPGEIFDVERYELLAKMNITVTLQSVMRQLTPTALENMTRMMNTVEPRIRIAGVSHDPHYH